MEPNPEMLAIARLFLEKLEKLTEAERDFYLRLMGIFSSPPMISIDPAIDLDRFSKQILERAAHERASQQI